MKYAHYDETNGKLLGWYDSEIHSTIPTPNIEVSDEDWQTAINNNYNFIDIDTNTLSFKDFSTFEQVQDRKLNGLVVFYNTTNQQDIAYMDITFQADSKSQALIVSVLSAGSVPDGFYWLDIDNNQVSMSYADLQGLSGTILERSQSNFTKLQDLKKQVKDATTQDDLDSIVW